MRSQEQLESIMYSLSKATRGRSPKLFQYFSLDPAEYDCVLPLTRLQQNVYLDTLIANDHSLYNVGLAMGFDGQLDFEDWKKAVGKVIQNEPGLRSCFVKKDMIIYQAVKKQVEPVVEFIDISAQQYSTAQLTEVIAKKNLSFQHDLFKAQSSVLVMYKVAPDKYYLVFFTHQVYHDALSARAFFMKAMQALKSNGDDQVSYQEEDYSEYIFYNNDNFDKRETLGFWEDKLQQTQDLFWEVTAPGRRGAYQRKRLIITEAEYSGIKEFCLHKNITPAVYFKALFSILLNYYFKPGSDFIFFENVHGRSRRQLSTIGLFFHPFPVRNMVSLLNGDARLDTIVNAMEDFKKAGTPYQEVSVEALNQILNPQGLRIIYNFLTFPQLRTLPAGTEFFALENLGGRSEIQLAVTERQNMLQLELLYHNTTFEDNSFLERLFSISGQVIKADGGIKDLEFILPAEKERISTFFRVDNSFPLHTSFTALFEEQVARHTTRMAVTFEDITWTYQELNEKANVLAAGLSYDCGVKQGNIVAVYMERSAYTLVAILAILKLKAVYLPVDVQLPPDRSNFMLEDARPHAIITTGKTLEVAGTSTSVEGLPLSLISTRYDGLTATTDLVYIIYTSGSTGKPKGALISSEGMINHLYEKIRLLEMSEKTVVAQTANVGFDISIWQFLSPLLTGGCVAIYPNRTILDIAAFKKQIHNDGVTILEVVPSYLGLLLEAAPTAWTQQLKYLLVTGEVVNVQMAMEWFTQYPDTRLVNAYGPTEAADDITHFVLEEFPEYAVMPIGKPISNSLIYIVDVRGKLCPVGFKGEIYVAGTCVGKGYLNDPERTNAAFCDNYFTNIPGQRLYKTGDLGAWSPDGNILYYGRKDTQIKIRGNRIETGEIENVLLHMDEVKDAIVLDKEDGKGDKYLVAYIRATQEIDYNSLKKFLSRRLPVYMVPAAFVAVAQWPLTENGKIDRAALKTLKEASVEGSYTPPVSSTEQQLSRIWSEVLGREEISITSSFFDLGGHSLKAIQVITRIVEIFDIKIDLETFFSNPTIEELAVMIDSRNWVKDENDSKNSREIIL